MKRTEIGSRIAIWSAKYINNNVDRKEKDTDVDIIQIESSKDVGNYMVEVSPKGNKYIKWIPVSKRLPDESEYDCVLVRILPKEGPKGIPVVIIAEFRNSVWKLDGRKENIEEMLKVKVTHWKPIPNEEVE